MTSAGTLADEVLPVEDDVVSAVPDVDDVVDDALVPDSGADAEPDPDCDTAVVAAVDDSVDGVSPVHPATSTAANPTVATTRSARFCMRGI